MKAFGGHRIGRAQRRIKELELALAESLGTQQRLRDELKATRLPPEQPQPKKEQPQPKKRRWDWVNIGSAITAMAALGALGFTALSLQQTRVQVSDETVQTAINQQGQVTDRFNAAIVNLGSTALDVRLGGIYALQRIMTDSPRDQPSIIEILSAYIRDHAPVKSGSTSNPASAPPPPPPATDIQAALEVLSNRDRARDEKVKPDLHGSDLAALGFGTFLGEDKLNISDANLEGVDLSWADLDSINLDGADLEGAILHHTSVYGANFTHADFSNADFTDAHGLFTNFTGAVLEEAKLVGVNFYGANLRGADLAGAEITNANFNATFFTDKALANATLRNVDVYNTALCRSSPRGQVPVKAGQGYKC